MLGLMQNWPLLIHRIIDHAAIQHGTREVVSRSVEGPLRRTTYAEIRQNALKIAKKLTGEGIRPGDRVATLAWNTDRHLALWYGISGMGAITHTVNPRLFPEQIAQLIDHAEDRLVFLDLTFVALMEGLQDKLLTVERYIVLTDAGHMPETSLRNAIAYEDWLAEADADFAWADLDENSAAGLCYTSGTTGGPKGVLYSHRSNVLHAMACAQPDYMGLSARTVVMPVVPLFHANSWSLAFSAPGDVEGVLDRDRQAFERACLPGGDAPVRLRRHRSCRLAILRNDGVERRIQRVDAGEGRFEQVGRAETAG